MSADPQANINDSYFDGLYKEIWRQSIPEALTKAEVDFLVEEAELTPNSNVLDLMCGYGRHLLGLARRGIRVTGIDNLPGYVSEINDIVREEHLPATARQQNVLDYQADQQFDLVICMGNNLSFFNQDESNKVFDAISKSLVGNGKLIFNSWMIPEVMYKQFQERAWKYVGDVKFLGESKFFYSPARIETESIFIGADGETEIKKAVDYMYSINEIEGFLKTAGLSLMEIWNVPNKKRFFLNDSRAYFVAKRIQN